MEYGTGKYLYKLIDGWAPKELSSIDVSGLCIDQQDKVYVLNRGTHSVLVFDREGNILASWGEGIFKRVHGCCIGPAGCIYCADDGNQTVSKFNQEGELLQVLGKKDQPSDTGYRKKSTLSESLSTIKQGGPPFNRPTGIALSSKGEIYISDGYGNARVHKFTPEGVLLFSWGEPGSAPGQFRLPHSIWVDKNDRVWVIDRENNRLQIFNAQGKFIDQWTDLNRPTDIYIDNEETVYISELIGRVSIFSIDGKLLARWGSEGEKDKNALFLAPHAITVDSHGDLYIGEVSMTQTGIDRGSKTVQKFEKKALF